MELFVCLSAADASELEWHKFQGTRTKRENRHRTHDLVLEKGDYFGIKVKRNGNVALYKQDFPRLEFLLKMPEDKRWYATLMKKSRPAKPKQFSGSTAQRIHTKTRSNARNFDDRMDGERPFMPRVRGEQTEVNRENYQYRVYFKGAKAKQFTDTSGRMRGIIRPNDVFGWRIKGTGKEVYILLQNDVRIVLPNKLGMDLWAESSLAPEKKQRNGTFDPSAIKREEALKQLQDRERKRAGVEEMQEELIKHRKRRAGHITRKIDIPFDDEEEDNVDEPVDEGPGIEDLSDDMPRPKRRRVRRRAVSLDDLDFDKEPEPESKPAAKPKPEPEPEPDAESDAIPFAESDIITFEGDEEERDWYVVNIEDKNGIIEAVLYDILDQPDELNIVRFPKAQQKHGQWKGVEKLRSSRKREQTKFDKVVDLLEVSKKKVI